MNPTATILATVIGAIVVGILFRIRQAQRESELGKRLGLQDIKVYEEQIKQIETKVIRGTEDYRAKKEAYDAKWRTKKPTTPSDGDTSGNSGGAS